MPTPPPKRARIRRRRFVAMLLVSLALHAVLLRWLTRHAPPAIAVLPRVSEFTLVYPTLSPAPVAVTAPPRAHRANGGTHSAEIGRGGTHSADSAANDIDDPNGGTHSADANSTDAVAEAPRASPLLKALSLAQLGGVRSDKWQGDTQQVPAAPSSLADKNAEGTALVQGWLIADGARDRVTRGAIHPYFNELGKALRTAAAHPPAFSGAHTMLTSFAHDYFSNAAAFGKSGIGASSPQGDGRIVALVELRQAADGAFQASLLLESSGSPAFDAHVLKSLPGAAAQLEAPMLAEGGLHPNGLRSVWAFEGSVRDLVDSAAKPTLKAKNLPLALLAPIGLLSGRMDQVVQSAGALGLLKTVYECSPRLVAVY